MINYDICLRLQCANLVASFENLSAPALSKTVSSKDSETQVIFVFLQRECSAKLFFFFFASLRKDVCRGNDVGGAIGKSEFSRVQLVGWS